MDIKNRLFSLNLPDNQSAFLWGPRKVGKSHWINHSMGNIELIDLLKTDIFADYASRPALLRERFSGSKRRIVIDEIQKVPALLDEVHWLIENKNIAFLLTGSSARKLRQAHANMLAGRAWRYTMTPLCYPEIKNFDLQKALISGLLPPHLLSPDPIQSLRAYIADYLKDEIAAEARVRDMPSFAEFLKVVALTSGELLNYTNIARETGVSAKIVREYFQILEDTLLGFRLQPWRRRADRRLIETEKFYLFDVGITNYLLRRQPAPQTPEFGKSFEQFILMELKAYQAYRNPEMQLYFWRTSTGQEVDFILNDMAIALEIKTKNRIYDSDAKGLRALGQSHHPKRLILIGFENTPKKLQGNIEYLPWQHFLDLLWSGKLEDDLA